MSINKDFTVDDHAELDIRVQSGRVEIREGEPGAVNVAVETADRGFVVEQQGNVIVVSSDKNSGWLSRGSAFVVIRAPRGLDATISTASARVDIPVHVSRLDVKTASGDIEIESCDALNVKTASGNTTMGSVTGSVRVTAASGDARVLHNCHGSAAFSTASGDVRINDSDAVVSANTVSGDVLIERFTGRQASIKSMSGNVKLDIPEGTELDLDVNIMSGRVDLPEKRVEPTPTVRKMEVKVKLVSGDLTIDRA